MKKIITSVLAKILKFEGQYLINLMIILILFFLLNFNTVRASLMAEMPKCNINIEILENNIDIISSDFAIQEGLNKVRKGFTKVKIINLNGLSNLNIFCLNSYIKGDEFLIRLKKGYNVGEKIFGTIDMGGNPYLGNIYTIDEKGFFYKYIYILYFILFISSIIFLKRKTNKNYLVFLYIFIFIGIFFIIINPNI